jgi:hypothetical protein
LPDYDAECQAKGHKPGENPICAVLGVEAKGKKSAALEKVSELLTKINSQGLSFEDGVKKLLRGSRRKTGRWRA